MKTKAGEGVWQRRCLIDVDGLLFDVRASDKKLPSLFSYLPKALTIIIQVTTVTTSSASVAIIISDNMKAKWLQPLFWRQSGSVSGTNRGNNEVTLSLDVLVDETEKIDNKQKKTHLTYSCYWSVQLTTYILSPIFCLSFCNLPGGARLFIYI